MFFLVFFLSVFLPLTVSAVAGTYEVCNGVTTSADGQCCALKDCSTTADTCTVCYEGIVPCGIGKTAWSSGVVQNGKCAGGTEIVVDGEKGIPCQLCHFFILGKGIFDYATMIVFLVTVLIAAISGFRLLLSSGDPSQVNSAKSALKNAAIGLVIIFTAWLVVNTLLSLLGIASWTGLAEGWFKINCQVVYHGACPPTGHH